MTARRRFTVTAPDWGPAHLSSDAVVAFVDGELGHGPHARAAAHVSACPECAAEVVAQRSARTALQAASCPSLPSALLSSLRAIPQDTELPGPPIGLAVSADGQLGSLLRADDTHGRRPPTSRLLRLGTGAAMSGLAIGALALGASVLPAVPGPPADQGAGPVLDSGPSVPARFALDAGVRAADDPGARRSAPRTYLRHGLR